MVDRSASESVESELDVQLHCSPSLEIEPETASLQAESPPLASALTLSTSFEDDVLDLKWRQSCCALPCSPAPVLSLFYYCIFFILFVRFFFHHLGFFVFFFFLPVSPFLSQDHHQGGVGVSRHVCVHVCFHEPSLSRCALGVCVVLQQITQRGCEVVFVRENGVKLKPHNWM